MKDIPAKNSDLETLIAQCRGGFPEKSLYILELPIFNPENGFPFLREILSCYAGLEEIRAGRCVAAQNTDEEGARAQNCYDYENLSRAGASQSQISNQ